MTGSFTVASASISIWISLDLAKNVTILVKFRTSVRTLVHDAALFRAVALHLTRITKSAPML